MNYFIRGVEIMEDIKKMKAQIAELKLKHEKDMIALEKRILDLQSQMNTNQVVYYSEQKTGCLGKIGLLIFILVSIILLECLFKYGLN